MGPSAQTRGVSIFPLRADSFFSFAPLLSFKMLVYKAGFPKAVLRPHAPPPGRRRERRPQKRALPRPRFPARHSRAGGLGGGGTAPEPWQRGAGGRPSPSLRRSLGRNSALGVGGHTRGWIRGPGRRPEGAERRASPTPEVLTPQQGPGTPAAGAGCRRRRGLFPAYSATGFPPRGPSLRPPVELAARPGQVGGRGRNVHGGTRTWVSREGGGLAAHGRGCHHTWACGEPGHGDWEAAGRARSELMLGAQGALRGLTAHSEGGSELGVRTWMRPPGCCAQLPPSPHSGRSASAFLCSARPHPQFFPAGKQGSERAGAARSGQDPGRAGARVGGCLAGIGGWSFHLGFAKAA